MTLGNVSIIEFFPKHVFPVNHRRLEKKLSQNCTKIFLTLMTALQIIRNHLDLMGVSGIVECFMTSERKRKLTYTHHIGGGDSKTHSEIVKSDP